MEAKEKKKPLVKDLNEHIVCPLCRGYLIDATTLVECLHSFCRGCILRRLSSGVRACPVCSVAASPLLLLSDVRLQRLVYLVVPGLFRSELERRRHFCLVNSQCPPLAPPVGGLDLTLDDFVSLSLQELKNTDDESKDSQERRTASENDAQVSQKGSTRYLKCPAGVTVRHLVRLLMLKRGWEEANAAVNRINRIEIMYQENDAQCTDEETIRPLDSSWTLLDLACIFRWKKEAPMKLFYRILRKEETIPLSKIVSACEDDAKKDDSPPTIENMQRPPTPPPSPKPSREPEAEPEIPRVLETGIDVRDKETTKTKKPRCEVTPVMRAPDPPATSLSADTHRSAETTRSKDLTRLEHRKRRKRRNKRVIAEITTTPREDLLKLKVRLTPCPPRITSSSGSGNTGSGANGSVATSGQTKEKLLQMRAVRREKIKAIGQQRSTVAGPLTRDENPKECNTAMEIEETIEDIIDSIPDEVVCIAQNIGTQNKDVDKRVIDKEESEESTKLEDNDEPKRPKKDEEILRRLGLVAINEAGNIDKMAKQRVSQNRTDKTSDNFEREKLEKQLRECKANRVRSLLAEKQMRDALKSIMSKTTKEERVSSSVSTAVVVGTSSSSTPVTMSTTTVPKKKEPPPLAPLHVAKTAGFTANNGALLSNTTSKYETPLDLSSGGTTINDNNVLDLSATLSGGGLPTFSSTTISSSSSIPSSSSSSTSMSCSVSSLSRSARPAIGTASSFPRKSKELDQQQQQRRGQESNLKTLSDVAVSRLSNCLTEKNPSTVESLALATVGIHTASKVALRIPQPHQRISGFGMKIKPNLGIRHIPNPQAVVASQYRNQRASYFNTVSQQPL